MTRKASARTAAEKQAEGKQDESASPTDQAKPRIRPLAANSSTAEPANKIGRPSRREQLIRMLSTKNGADLAAISAKFGWLPHTSRAALSGLRKAGHRVVTEKRTDGKPTRYRLAAQTGAALLGDGLPSIAEPREPASQSDPGSSVAALADPTNASADNGSDPAMGAA